METYKKYSDYLKNKYGEKVYKLPVNLPITCPNRLAGSQGCDFCSEKGTGFEAMDSIVSVCSQLTLTREKIAPKYHAKKFIAYFQNYTNTFLEIEKFREYLKEAAALDFIVCISISTRPDCISDTYLQVMQQIQESYGVDIHIELGLQTANYHVLHKINRGHSLAEYIDAMLRIKAYSFPVCTHIILNLPGDTLEDSIETAKIVSALGSDIVKLHSLYIAKNTKLCNDYEDGKITLCSKEEYYLRVKNFLEYLDPDIIVERLFSRIPEQDSVFSNWNTSWWKLMDELMEYLKSEESYQGKKFQYLNGSKLALLKQEE